MGFCSFAKDSGLYDSTPIENLFLSEYLASAPADCLRVYLCLKMLCLHPEMGMDDGALPAMLRLEEETVQNALRYWEREGLLRRVSDNPPTYELIPMRQAQSQADPMEQHYYEYRDFNAELQQIFGMEELLHPKQYAMANDWVTVFGMSKDAVITLVREGMKTGPKRVESLFKKLDKFVQEWSDSGLATPEQVLYAWSRNAKNGGVTDQVLRRLGIHRAPSQDEMDLTKKWMEEWGLSVDGILNACAETVRARNPSMAYLDSILASRREGNGAAFEATKAILAELGRIGERPGPDEIAKTKALMEQGFEPETLAMAAAQSAQKNRRSFEDFLYYAGLLSERGLYAHADAETYVSEQKRLTEELRDLLQKAGIEKRPGKQDLELYEGWRAAFPASVLELAAQYTHGKPNAMAYLKKLLEGWQSEGVTDADSARASHEKHVQSGNAAVNTVNPALNYEQRSYTGDDLAGLELDLDHYGDEEGKA